MIFIKVKRIGLNIEHGACFLVVYKADASSVMNWRFFNALNILNKRHEFGTMVDTILYNSLDSYYSTRSTYLQTRLNEPPEPMEDNLDLFDPYEDF